MDPYLYQAEQLIPRSLSEVFTFFSCPENLGVLTPPGLHFKVLTPSPIPMKEGAVIDYTIRLLGVSVRWTTLITECDAPRRFVDVQLKGPYSFWQHTHLFEETAEGVLMKDEVRYAIGWGPLGSLINGLMVRRDLEKIFEFRRRKISEIFGAKSNV